jgi:GrpB-like predicted nucleotidyltransferase (UPF0157 family)
MDFPLGLQRGVVTLAQYNPKWRELFEAEKADLQEILGDKFIDAEHVGSTAIPGLKAKPILDLMLSIESLDNWEWIKAPLTKLGYEFRHDLRKEQGHVLFVKGPERNRTHYLKVTEINSDFWTGQILFRDYLIKHPQSREEYQNLKEKMLDEHSGNREPYTKGKEEFVRKILKLAGFKGEIL